ncbi:hypothetical protein BMWSH_5052 [Priestia megaterium WSH-002]|uniref:Uncharacterized protein n=1 Tax=Priestia megaterium (strain WSH-002) TaxID=1006007 RepID=A0A8D3X3U7_PRIMW|nr:hypothetical protein BMWSH_5052 [Priestia megaterium WSH-002]
MKRITEEKLKEALESTPQELTKNKLNKGKIYIMKLKMLERLFLKILLWLHIVQFLKKKIFIPTSLFWKLRTGFLLLM